MCIYSSLHADPFVIHTVSRDEARVALVLWCLIVHHEHSIGKTIDSLEAQIKILQMIVIMLVEYQEASIAAHSCLLTPKRKLTLSGCETSRSHGGDATAKGRPIKIIPFDWNVDRRNWQVH